MKYEIDYSSISELPNKTLQFKILDEKKEVAGYAMASAIDSFAICGATLNELNKFTKSDDFTELENDLKRFCKVYYHTNSDGPTKS